MRHVTVASVDALISDLHEALTCVGQNERHEHYDGHGRTHCDEYEKHKEKEVEHELQDCKPVAPKDCIPAPAFDVEFPVVEEKEVGVTTEEEMMVDKELMWQFDMVNEVKADGPAVGSGKGKGKMTVHDEQMMTVQEFVLEAAPVVASPNADWGRVTTEQEIFAVSPNADWGRRVFTVQEFVPLAAPVVASPHADWGRVITEQEIFGADEGTRVSKLFF